jgi:hypothetical protein
VDAAGSLVTPGDLVTEVTVFSNHRDHDRMLVEDSTMPTVEEESAIPAEVVAELEEAVDRLMKGIRDPEIMQQAAQEMDTAREELRKRHGEMNIAVDLIRESRDEP